MIVPWNDADAVARRVRRARFAAILAEPYPANMGLVPPRRGFLELLRDAADEHRRAARARRGHHRLPRRAAAARRSCAGVTARPDDHGQGPSAAACPRRPTAAARLMERIAPAGDVYQAGTLSGNPLAVAAGLATLALLDEPAYVRLARRPSALAAGLREAAGDRSGAIVTRPAC